jgi:hypothetical protein
MAQSAKKLVSTKKKPVRRKRFGRITFVDAASGLPKEPIGYNHALIAADAQVAAMGPGAHRHISWSAESAKASADLLQRSLDRIMTATTGRRALKRTATK